MMDEGVGKVHEKRPVPVIPHERDCLIGKTLAQLCLVAHILHYVHDLVVAHYGKGAGSHIPFFLRSRH